MSENLVIDAGRAARVVELVLRLVDHHGGDVSVAQRVLLNRAVPQPPAVQFGLIVEVVRLGKYRITSSHAAEIYRY